MRALHITLLLLMILFAAVQYNDPDGPMWMAIYAVPALWCALAAFKRDCLLSKTARWLLPACAAVSAAAMVYFWPKTQGWWKQEVWWEVETAREGMGMMIVLLVLMVVWFSTPRSRQQTA